MIVLLDVAVEVPDEDAVVLTDSDDLAVVVRVEDDIIDLIGVSNEALEIAGVVLLSFVVPDLDHAVLSSGKEVA
jgi:hypothetical protein